MVSTIQANTTLPPVKKPEEVGPVKYVLVIAFDGSVAGAVEAKEEADVIGIGRMAFRTSRVSTSSGDVPVIFLTHAHLSDIQHSNVLVNLPDHRLDGVTRDYLRSAAQSAMMSVYHEDAMADAGKNAGQKKPTYPATSPEPRPEPPKTPYPVTPQR